jgi:hypothetical protein
MPSAITDRTSGHSPVGLAVMRALLHPDHRAVAPLLQPLPQPLGGLRRGIGARDSAIGEPDFRRFGLY